MVIDRILDRYDGIVCSGGRDFYDPREFYYEMLSYHADKISAAMDYGTETDVRRALCDYVQGNGYNERICDFIYSVEWLTPGNGRYVDFLAEI